MVLAPHENPHGAGFDPASGSTEGTPDGSVRVRPMSPRAKSTKTKRKDAATGRGKPPKGGASAVRQLQKRLAETLEQQAASSEILRVIGATPNDLQPVFDMIAERAMRLCGAAHAGVVRFDGELIHLVSHAFVSPEFAEALQRTYPMRPGPSTAGARAILNRAIVHIPDIGADLEYRFGPAAQAAGFRSNLAVPMLRNGEALGAIVVLGARATPFSEQQI